MLTVNVVPKGFREAEKALAHMNKAFPRATASAINYGLRAGNTLAAKLITQRYNIKSGDIKAQGLGTSKASYEKLTGQLYARGPMLPVSLFAPSAKRRIVKGKRGSIQTVKAKILKGKGNIKVIKGAFQAKGRIWERRPVGTSDRNAPLGIVSTIGVPFMIGQLGIATQVQNTIEQKTAERLEHNVNYELSKKQTSSKH